MSAAATNSTPATTPRIAVQRLPRFVLESGEVLRDVDQAYALAGTVNEARDNVVLVLHSLTGAPETFAGWSPYVVGPGRPIDTDRYAVLCPNLLGSCYGTTYAGDGGERPKITTRDQARLIGRLLDELEVPQLALVTGGSLGGMVALEWAATFPHRARSVAAFAAPAAHTAWGIGWNHVQRRIVEALGDDGLGIARMIGMLTYRTHEELAERFGRADAHDDDGFAVRSYLSHHGKKLVARFVRDSYLALLDAMDSHDVGRSRRGVGPALGAFPGRLVGIGIAEDLLYTNLEVRQWTRAAGAEYREISSDHGHDGFLIETGPVGALLRELLDEPRALAGARASTLGDVPEAARALYD